MDKSQMILKKFVAAKSRYFDLPDGEEAQVKFLSAEEVPNNFDGGKSKCIRYHFERDGIEQLWDRTSRDLSKQMAEISEGDLIAIKRSGHKNKTKYYVRKVE